MTTAINDNPGGWRAIVQENPGPRTLTIRIGRPRPDGSAEYVTAIGPGFNGVQVVRDTEVFPEAVQRMRAWRAGGGRIVGVSNQGGIALGHVSEADVIAAMLETQRQTGGLFDKIAYCRHHPAAEHPEMARCWCRKPAPGLLISSADSLGDSTGEIYPPYMALMVGDRDEDRECARIASVDFEWAAKWRSGIRGTTAGPGGAAT